MQHWFSGLWRHPDFLRLWAGQTVSVFGTQVTALALPLTAALTLHATPFQMGLLTAAERMPFLLIGLFAGAWIDRRRRRPTLIVADLGRAGLLATVPAAALAGVLSVELLLVVAVLVGSLTVFFDVAYLAYLPSLIARGQLVEGNSKLEVSASVAQVAGPGLGGVLVGLLTAPVALAIDACSFLVSALFLARIRTAEPPPAPRGPESGVWSEIAEGMRFLLGDPILRSLAVMSAITAMFGFLFLAVYVLFMARDLALPPETIGVILGAGGLGALAGAVISGPLADRFGLGPTIVWSELVFTFGNVLVPIAIWVPGMAVPLLAAGEVLAWAALQVRAVNGVSLRQTLTPDHLQGRVNATFRFLVFGSMPIGALAGGLLGEAIGLGPTLTVGVAGMFLAFIWLLLSPLRSFRHREAGAPI